MMGIREAKRKSSMADRVKCCTEVSMHSLHIVELNFFFKKLTISTPNHGRWQLKILTGHSKKRD
jgi:hypothetical protein